MLSRTTDTTFMNIIILKISIVFYLSQNILVLASFYIETIYKFDSLQPQEMCTKEEKNSMYDNASGLYNEFI